MHKHGSWTPGFLVAAILVMGALCPPSFANDGPWDGIRKDAFGDREIIVNEGMISLEAPVRAEDAAVVPISVRIPAQYASQAKAVTLIIDKNPAPVAAAFTFGPAAGEGDRTIATRVRIDMYSNVRAILETTDGKLYMTSRYVKASGGCSAPAQKDADAALAELGQLRVKTFSLEGAVSSMREAQVMIRHPNYTGMQMNQITRDYTPAKFVETIEVRRGKDLVFVMTGGISLSENPNIRFSYAASPDEPLEVTAKDTDGGLFTGRSAAGS